MAPGELLKAVKYPSPEKFALIKKAYRFSEKARAKSRIYGNEPVFERARETAKILGEIGMGRNTIAASLLYPAVIHGKTSEKELEKEFGDEIVFLIQQTKRLGTIQYNPKRSHLESLVKFFLASAEDIRILIIKLAERLVIMRGVWLIPRSERQRVAEETMVMYVPLAERLGISSIKRELEMSAFSILNPGAHKDISHVLKEKEKREEKSLAQFKNKLLKILRKENLPLAGIDFRVKSSYSIYKKLSVKGDIHQIYDIKALRLNMAKITDCYQALALIHSNWKPLPNRTKDYIASPKADGYQSIHTTIVVDDGAIVEVQIRTIEMHERAERGIISHDFYKRNEKNPLSQWFHIFFPQPKNEKAPEEGDMVKKVPDWIKKVVDVKSYASVETKTRKGYSPDFFKERMFAFSPEGEVLDLPKDATVLDFAFASEPEKALHLLGGKINGKPAAMATKIKNGDIVEIRTGKITRPQVQWFKYAKTPSARNHIAEYFASKSS
ncbi:MAG: HD domain-containing protein [Patescibacteria group bacterium]|mgnify:FL=1